MLNGCYLVRSKWTSVPLLLVLSPLLFHLTSLVGLRLSLARPSARIVDKMRRGGHCLGGVIS